MKNIIKKLIKKQQKQEKEGKQEKEEKKIVLDINKKRHKILKKVSVFNIVLNVIIAILIGVFAWMVTQSSSGQDVDYNGNFVISSSNVEAKLYCLIDGQYILQKENTILNTQYLEPGSMNKYKLDVENTADVYASTKIVFSNITGDIDKLKDYIVISISSPNISTFKLADKIQYDETSSTYYLDFYDYLKVEPNSTAQVYFNVSVLKDATNEIENLSLSVDKLLFINP